MSLWRFGWWLDGHPGGAHVFASSEGDFVDADIVYSVRLVIDTYAGPLFKLRRDSDDAEMDFDPVGVDPPLADITAWLNGANGFGVTWYDQGAKALHTTQSDHALQPAWDDVVGGFNITADTRLSSYPPYVNSAIFTNAGATAFMVIALTD